MTVSALRILGAGGLAMACAWMGARVYVSWHPPTSGMASRASAAMASAPISRDADDSSTLPANIPDALPVFSLNDLRGHATPIASWTGKSLVINFWATWCAPCRHEIPLLNTLAGEWESSEVTVVGIAVDDLDKVRKFKDQFHIGYPLLIGEQDALDVAAKFGVASAVFPFTVFTDRRGEVVALFVGELHRSQAELIMTTVRDLDRGTLLLADARRQITSGLLTLAART